MLKAEPNRAKLSQAESKNGLLEQASTQPCLAWIHRLWQYRLWSFTFGDTKSIRLLPKPEVFQRIL